MDLLLNKMTVLLERNEHGYKEIHHPMWSLPQRKSKSSCLPLQMTDIPECPFNKIAIDLVTKCETSCSGNKHILTIIDHLMGWPEAFPIPDKSADTIESTFINQDLPVSMCPRYILSANGTEFKNQLKLVNLYSTYYNQAIPSSHLNSLGSIQATRLPLDTVNLLGMHIFPPLTINAGTHFTYPQTDGGLSQPPARLSWEWVLNLGPVTCRSTALPTELSWMDKVHQQLGIEQIFSAPYHPQSNGKLEVFHKYLKPTLKKLCEKDPSNWDKYINQVPASYRVTPNLAIAETPFFLVYGRDPNLPLHQLLKPMQRFLGDPESGLLNLEAHCLALVIAKKTLDENHFRTAQNTTEKHPHSR